MTDQTRTPLPPDASAAIRIITQTLSETDPEPIRQIRRIVQVIGPEAALAILEETTQVEARGGMLTKDGKRRRTPGGVYFQLAWQRLDPQDRRKIFIWRRGGQSAHTSAAPPAVAPAEPKTPPFQLANLPTVLQELANFGEVSTVKITVIGRPTQVVQRGDVVILGMINEKAPTLPKGLPQPPAQTRYVVMVAKKQWNKVADAIKDSTDALIIEGYPAFAQQHAGITVFTTNITTKHQQRAKREAQTATS